MIHFFTHENAVGIDFGVPGHNEEYPIYIPGSPSNEDGDYSENASGEVVHVGDDVAADAQSHVRPSM